MLCGFSMDLQYIDLIKEWVKLDNVIQVNQEEVKKAKDDAKKLEERVSVQVEQKKTIEGEIINYIQSNKLENIQLKISDGVITFGKKTSQKPMSQKFLRETMQKYADENPDENIQFEKILEFIGNNIEKKTTYEINRLIKPPPVSE